MKKILSIIVLIVCATTSLSVAQQASGHWDANRASLKEITLGADSRCWRRIDLPTGTTEVAIRVTLLDDNQQLTSSFASLLAGIPTTEAFVASSTVNLLSKVAGDDKCTYAVFKTQHDADAYMQTGHYQKACHINNTAINRDVTLLKKCLFDSPEYLYVAFHSTNIFMNERIILEVVPWVDTKASAGWTKAIKEDFISRCKTSTTELSDPNSVCLCMLGKFEANYRVEDFSHLAEAQIDKISEQYAVDCIKETGEEEKLVEKKRNEAEDELQKSNYSNAIGIYLDMIDSRKAACIDYNNLGYCYIVGKQYLKAIKYLKEGEKIDESELLVKGNLAHAYLLNGDTELAKAIYLKYKSQNVNEELSWTQMIKLDFDEFKKRGLDNGQFDWVISLLK